MSEPVRRLAILAASACGAWLLPFAALAAGSQPFAPDGVPQRPDALFVCGALMMMGLYHLVLFFARKTNLAALSLAAYCLLRVANSLCSEGSDWSIRLFVPAADPHIVETIGAACLTLSFPVLQAFFRRLFPRQFPGWGLAGFAFASFAILAAGLLHGFAGWVVDALMLCVLAVSAYSIVNLSRAWRARESGAALLLFGYLFMVGSGINDMLLAKRAIVGVWLTPVGTLCFVLCQSGLLALRFARAFASIRQLSARLEHQKRALEAEMLERDRLERKLNTISEEERRFVSSALHDGLCQELTAARLRCSLLLSASQERRDTTELARLAELLEGAVDQAYELSHGLWPLGQKIADLPRALRELGEEMAMEHGIDVSVRDETAGARPTSTQVEHVFLIAKEALKNVVKHAGACHVDIVLRHPNGGAELELTVADDGIGLGAAARTKGGLGTKIMAHHAESIGAALSISPRPEGGTCVRLVLPCAA